MTAEANIAGTSGGQAVTNGSLMEGLTFSRRLWLLYGLVLLTGAGIGASSFWIEDTRNGIAAPAWCYAVNELTSMTMLFLLTPWLLRWTARLDPRRIGWPRAAAGHAVGLAMGSALHIGGMVALRYALYPLFGGQYRFGASDLPLQLVYELRKDAVAYIGLVALIWLIAMARQRMRPPVIVPVVVTVQVPGSVAPQRRLEIRDGAKRVFLDPAEILWAEAAGNYVELHLAGKSWLQRQTLSVLERDLAELDFVRIHRSRLVNRRHVRGLTSNDSGDFTVSLSDGRQIAGGRRWREALQSFS